MYSCNIVAFGELAAGIVKVHLADARCHRDGISTLSQLAASIGHRDVTSSSTLLAAGIVTLHLAHRSFLCNSLPSPLHGAKSDLPKSHRILPRPGSNERSRSPLSIGALRAARGDRIRGVTNFASKTCFIFPVQSRPLARLVQDDGSRKLPRINHS